METEVKQVARPSLIYAKQILIWQNNESNPNCVYFLEEEEVKANKE